LPEEGKMSRAAALKAWETRRARAAASSPARLELVRDIPVGTAVVSAEIADAFGMRGLPNTIVIELPVRYTPADAEEWAQLEAAHADTWNGDPVACGVPQSNKPHPQSYGADLPLRGLPLKGPRATHKWTRGTISTKAPHPDSYGAHLPLRGLGLGSTKPTCSWTISAVEKRALALRPVVIVPNVYTPATFDKVTNECTYCGERAGPCQRFHRNGVNA
jgi:hypothetical protein